MKPLPWQYAAVIVAFLVCITALGLTGHDAAALIAVGMAILAALGLALGQGQAVKDHVNGNTSKLLDIVEKQGKMLAAMQPTPAVIDGEVVDEAQPEASAAV
jgi:hypothetical protein